MEQKTYIEELREKESSYGKIFKVSGPRNSHLIQWSSQNAWADPRCTSSSRSATTNWSEKSSNSMETPPTSSATKIPVTLPIFSRTHRR